ncbi:MAG TPA: MFS transporter [Candidatus Limnocylindrales bacterium]|nr:MFS transporter [Candidatus Limnocylindrales bacterium]
MATQKATLAADDARGLLSPRYEFALVVLFFFTWGTVFLDRMSVLYLAPFIAPDLHLSHEQVGLLASSLAVSWALSSLLFGAISDRIGRRPVLVPAVFAFSALSWLSGVARSFSQLFTVRTLMGVAEGPTWATITATIEESSAPQRRGRNVGVVVSAAALVGLTLAPILTTQIAARWGWRSACFAAGIPGLLLGLILWKFVRETGKTEGGTGHARPTLAGYLSLLRHRNMLLCCLGSAGFMTWLWVMHAFAPLYITEVTKNSATFAGLILAASGLGAFVWGLVLPWASDYTGRKPALLVVGLISAVVPLTYQMPFLISHPWLMAIAGFVANGGQCIAALTLVVIPTESVPPQFAATAIGLATLVGEIVGGTIAPAISGAAADRYGLGASLWIAAGGAIMVAAASLFMRETAPARAGNLVSGSPA